MKKITLQIDGHTIEAAQGENLLQAALDAGIYIPHLCYHPDLTPQGGCKLCTVEIQGSTKLVQSCETIVEEGMVVNTKTDKVKHLRQVALELMLASHPKDCTSCDKYLNCELQALMQYMGVAHSRLKEIEKDNTRISVSDNLIQKEMFRCIQCGRCVRACSELRGVDALSYNKKNGETYVGTKDDLPHNETDCRFCGACVEVCPTGAIQDVKGVFSKESPKYLSYIPCKDACPAHTDIPTYVRLTGEGNYGEAVSVLREKLTFPHSLGFVCTHVCETECKRTHLNEAVSIRELKKFAVENDKEALWKKKVEIGSKTDKRVAVIGGGASGMTGAYYLAKKGHAVTVYERQARAGGMLSYGIPKYRLPQDVVDREIDILLEAGIELKLGRDVTSVNDLKDQGYDAVLLAVGSQQGKRPPQYRKDWKNVYNAVDFCRMANTQSLPELGDCVTVYGGGNVAFDCARSAKKAGIANVRVICLEAREDMLADQEEIDCALEEGIDILNSKSMENMIEANSRIEALNLVDVVSFSFGASGLEMETRAGSEQTLQTDALVFATGQQPDLNEAFGVALYRGTHIVADDSLKTSADDVFATGDAVYGTKSVVEAIASGRKAAMNIDKYLGGDGRIEDTFYERPAQNSNIGVIENFAAISRVESFHNACDANREGSRCLQCDLRLDIQSVKYWVDPQFKKVKEVTK